MLVTQSDVLRVKSIVHRTVACDTKYKKQTKEAKHMLSRGMNKKKWVRLLVVILAVLLVIIAVSALSIFLFYQWLDSIPSAMEITAKNEYFQKMLLLQETSDTAKVGDVFDFDFDEAYVVSAPYGDGTFYLDKLGVETAVPLPSYDTGGHYRILFIKDQCVIYDFVYCILQVDTLQKDVMIYPDTTMTFTTEFYPSGNSFLRITFDDSIVSGILY